MGFTILTKRIASLELNLTKQQMHVSNLLNLFGKIDALDQRFDEYQLNLTNHMLFQSYAISMMLKSIKNSNINVVNTDDNDNNDNDNDNNNDNDMYSDWSSQR